MSLFINNITHKKKNKLLRENNIKENHDLFVNAFSKILKSSDLPFTFKKPNLFIRFGRWICSFFKDNRVQMSYDFGDLADAVLTFKKEDRPNCQIISDQLIYFSENIEENNKMELEEENSQYFTKENFKHNLKVDLSKSRRSNFDHNAEIYLEKMKKSILL